MWLRNIQSRLYRGSEPVQEEGMNIMPENSSPTYSQLIRRLPYRLQRRFESFGNYVDGILSEKEPKGGWNLSEEDIDGIKLIALIFALKAFLYQGTIIARQAITVFGNLGAEGFTVGNTNFTDQSEDTYRGEKLSKELNKLLAETTQLNQLLEDKSISSIIVELARRSSNRQSMDRSRKNT